MANAIDAVLIVLATIMFNSISLRCWTSSFPVFIQYCAAAQCPYALPHLVLGEQRQYCCRCKHCPSPPHALLLQPGSDAMVLSLP